MECSVSQDEDQDGKVQNGSTSAKLKQSRSRGTGQLTCTVPTEETTYICRVFIGTGYFRPHLLTKHNCAPRRPEETLSCAEVTYTS